LTSPWLTPAEARVLRAYSDFQTHAAAAKELGISTQTLKNQLGSVYKKLGVRKAHAANYRLAQAHGVDIYSPPKTLTATKTVVDTEANEAAE